VVLDKEEDDEKRG
jgi:hypothetical protein